MPPAARISDAHRCPKHVKGKVAVGEATVLIGFMPAARAGDALDCAGRRDAIKQGEGTVLIGNKPAARLGDPTNHGGALIVGDPTVLIGSSAQAETLKTNKPFCEECEAKRKKREAQAKRGRD